MSIFDSIMNDINPLDAAGELFSAAGLGKATKADTASNSPYQGLSQQNLLSSREMSLPYTQGREFTASKSKAADQVDAESINQQWLQRLKRYYSIATDTGSKR